MGFKPLKAYFHKLIIVFGPLLFQLEQCTLINMSACKSRQRLNSSSYTNTISQVRKKKSRTFTKKCTRVCRSDCSVLAFTLPSWVFSVEPVVK